MRLCNINTNLINVIQNVYEKVTSEVCSKSSTGDWLGNTVGVKKDSKGSKGIATVGYQVLWCTYGLQYDGINSIFKFTRGHIEISY